MPETTKRCQVEMADGKPCGRELYDDECCIFHSKKKNKELKLFQQRFDEILKNPPLEDYDFSRFIFPKGVISPRVFSKSVIFLEAVFKGDADFSDVVFQGEADFWDVAFEAGAFFVGTVFKDWGCFMGAAFKGVTTFFGAVFEGRASFRYASFEEGLEIYAGDVHKKSFEQDVNFCSAKFSKPEKVEFRKVDLSKFTFLETDVRKVHFMDVDWNKKKGKGRNMIFDEVEPDPASGKFDNALIAQLYQRLRANYEENLRYSEAGDFYIGEMEMTRKAERNVFKKLPLLFYKAISNYGESYYRPLGWIAAILLIFPLLFMFAGIEPVSLDQNNLMGDVIHYRLDFSSIESTLPTTEKVGDYYTSFLYSMSVFSFIRDKKYTTIDNWRHTLFVLESILSPVTLAFFLLALRRRFKR